MTRRSQLASLILAIATLSSAPSDASTIQGHTLKASFSTFTHACTKLFCSNSSGSNNILIYFGSGGHVFDYGTGQAGDEFSLNVPYTIKEGVVHTTAVRGNTISIKTVINGSQTIEDLYQVHGSTCTISERATWQGMALPLRATVRVVDPNCEFVAGHEER